MKRASLSIATVLFLWIAIVVPSYCLGADNNAALSKKPAKTFNVPMMSGIFCKDWDDNNGLFDNGCGGPNYVYFADSRTELLRRIRTALEFDLSSAPKWNQMQSALLKITMAWAHDSTVINEDQTSGPVFTELHGYFGDGVATASDLTIDNLLITVVIPYTGYPQVEPNVVYIDVTSFVKNALRYGSGMVGFNFRVEDELEPGTLADACLFGDLSDPGANTNPDYVPQLVISRSKGDKHRE